MRELLKQEFLNQDWIQEQPESYKKRALESYEKRLDGKLDYIDWYNEPMIYSLRDNTYYIFRDGKLENVGHHKSENDLDRLTFEEFNKKFNSLGNSLKEQFSDKAQIENQLKIILSPEDTEKWFLSQIKETINFSGEQKLNIIKAMNLCKTKHKGQLRDEGVEYYSHPIFTAIKGLEFGMSYEDILVLLLHDTIEDTDLTFDEIKKEFGEYVASKVLSLSKKENGKIIISTEDYYINLSNDEKLAVLKGIDRLANIFSLNFGTKEKKVEYLKETIDIIIPMVSKYNSELVNELNKLINYINNELFTLPPELVSKLDDIQKINKIKDGISK
ncbi:MAG: HD domain-containing protein [Candidatus Gracilibacteria bacterium]|nr:HD domain-containing protein [Candidatus Gracilibacteria bacterium]MDD2908581.1 HD domain-containing protein [Candidatus Gracilibacteria bacterium]